MLPGGQQVGQLTPFEATLGMMCDSFRDSRDATCETSTTGYYNDNKPLVNADIYDNWVIYGSVRGYSDCAVVTSNQAADQQDSYGSTCLQEVVAGSPVAALGMERPIVFMNSLYTYPEWFAKAKELALQGVTLRDLAEAGDLQYGVPQSVMNGIDSFVNPLTSSNDDAEYRAPLGSQLIAMDEGAMWQVPDNLRNNPDVQEAIGQAVIGRARQIQQDENLDAEGLLNRLLGTYISNVEVAGTDADGDTVIGVDEITGITVEFARYPVQQQTGGGSGLVFPIEDGKITFNADGGGFIFVDGVDNRGGGSATTSLTLQNVSITDHFLINGGLTFFYLQAPALIQPLYADPDIAFAMTDGETIVAGLKEIYVAPTGSWTVGDDSDITVRLSGPLGVINTRGWPEVEAARISASPFADGTRDPAGSSRGLGAGLKLKVAWPNGTFVGASATVTSGRTGWYYLPDRSPTTWDGTKIVASIVGNVYVGSGVSLSLPVVYSQIIGGSLDGSRRVNVELGAMWNSNMENLEDIVARHSVGASLRFNWMQEGGLDLYQVAAGVSGTQTLYDDDGWHFMLNEDFTYIYTDLPSMTIGDPDDFGSGTSSSTRAGPFRIETELETNQLGIFLTPSVRLGVPGSDFGLWDIGLPLGVICTGDDSPSNCGGYFGAALSTNFDLLPTAAEDLE